MDCSALGLVEWSAKVPANGVVASESRSRAGSWPLMPSASTPISGVAPTRSETANEPSAEALLALSCADDRPDSSSPSAKGSGPTSEFASVSSSTKPKPLNLSVLSVKAAGSASTALSPKSPVAAALNPLAGSGAPPSDNASVDGSGMSIIGTI